MTWSGEEERREYVPDKPYCHRLPTCSQRLWPRFDQYLRERNLDPALARKNVWFPSRTVDGYDRLVVVGTSDQPGNLYWQARLLDPPERAQDAPGSTIPPRGAVYPLPRRWESPHGISRGNSLCLVWPNGVVSGRPTAVVEGPMDALAAAGEGYVAIGLMGIHPSDQVLEFVAKLLRGTRPLLVTDLNAEKDTLVVQARLREMELPTTVVSPYPGKDLAALDRPVRRKVLRVG